MRRQYQKAVRIRVRLDKGQYFFRKAAGTVKHDQQRHGCGAKSWRYVQDRIALGGDTEPVTPRWQDRL